MHSPAQPIPAVVVKSCSGPGRCPNAISPGSDLARSIEGSCRQSGIEDYLRNGAGGEIRRHHQFRIVLSHCPNGCSQPQIVDLGLLAATVVVSTQEECTLCGACVQACRESAVTLNGPGPLLDPARCLHCGQCARACPTGHLSVSGEGWRVQLGGRLGRRPRLARELAGIFSDSQVLALVRACLTHHMTHARPGERFGEVLERVSLPDVVWKDQG